MQFFPKPGAVSFKRLLGGNKILTLDQAAGVVARRDVLKRDVPRHCTEERNAATDEHGNARDDETVNEPGLKKPLNRDPAIHVDMPDTPSCKLRHDVGGSPRHSLHHSPGRCGGEGTRTEDDNRLVPIGPGTKRQDGL